MILITHKEVFIKNITPKRSWECAIIFVCYYNDIYFIKVSFESEFWEGKFHVCNSILFRIFT